MSADPGFTSEPFTVALCTACTSELADAIMLKLRKVIGNCPHGVLVVTQCLLGEFTCATRHSENGAMLLLQPCTVGRVPVASVRWVGPITNDAEVDAACRWIAAGSWDRQTLPLSLRADLNLSKTSRQN